MTLPAVLAALTGWRDEPSVNNSGGWTEASMKIPGQLGDAEGAKWSGVHAAVHYRAAKHQSWMQERQGSAAVWPSMCRFVSRAVCSSFAGYRTVTDHDRGRHSAEILVAEVDNEQFD